MFRILKALVAWILPEKPAPKKEEQASRAKILIFAPLRVMNQILACSRCGTRLPASFCLPEVAKAYLEGMQAAVNGDGIGANPYWAGKNFFAVAGWNMGWRHAGDCGNKKEPKCSM